MKGYFSDSKDWTIKAQGDWRGKDGEIIPYSDEKSIKEILISGGGGMYSYMMGNFIKAISFWEEDLERIQVIERQQDIRLHKGWFYYQLYLAYKNLGRQREYRNYLRLAKTEDEITYKNKAKEFPSGRKR